MKTVDWSAEWFRGLFEGALENGDKRLVLIVSGKRPPAELENHARVQHMTVLPQKDDPLLAEVALIVLSPPYAAKEAQALEDKLPKMIFARCNLFAEDALAQDVKFELGRALKRNPYVGNGPKPKRREVPKEPIWFTKGPQRRAAKSGPWIELPLKTPDASAQGDRTTFVINKARPGTTETIAEDVRAVLAIFPEGPKKPSYHTLYVTYSNLLKAGKLRPLAEKEP